MKTLKQVIGIDVSKDTFHVCLGTMNENQTVQLMKHDSFENKAKGFKEFFQWKEKNLLKDVPLWHVLEATGVYYENLAYALAASKENICVLLPNKSKHFARSLDIKTKTDKVDAAILCRIGLERVLPCWQIPSEQMKQIKALCRENRYLKMQSAKVKVRLHALAYSYKPEKQTIRRLKQQLSFFQKQIAQTETEIRNLVNEDPSLKAKIENIEKVKGLSLITIITVIAETNGFACIESAKQLASYAGLDVVMNQSGLHSGRTRISKKGNRHIRTALYLPAMSSVRYNIRLKQFYNNVMKNHSCGKIGIVAVARKLLILIYTLWKNNVPYNPELNVQK